MAVVCDCEGLGLTAANGRHRSHTHTHTHRTYFNEGVARSVWGAEVDHLGLAGWRSPPPYRCSGPRWRRLGNTSKAGRTGGRWQPHHPHQTASRGRIKMLQQSCSSIKPISVPLYEACRTTEEVLAGLICSTIISLHNTTPCFRPQGHCFLAGAYNRVGAKLLAIAGTPDSVTILPSCPCAQTPVAVYNNCRWVADSRGVARRAGRGGGDSSLQALRDQSLCRALSQHPVGAGQADAVPSTFPATLSHRTLPCKFWRRNYRQCDTQPSKIISLLWLIMQPS